MTDKAIAAFVAAIKRDRHDWKDWPEDSREAFVALQAAQPDCRTCDYYVKFEGCTRNSRFGVCTNGDKYEEATKVVLWRTE